MHIEKMVYLLLLRLVFTSIKKHFNKLCPEMNCALTFIDTDPLAIMPALLNL